MQLPREQAGSDPRRSETLEQQTVAEGVGDPADMFFDQVLAMSPQSTDRTFFIPADQTE